MRVSTETLTFISQDPCFMVKEVHPAEGEKLLAMLEGYVNHFIENPDSPMVKIVGLSKVRWQQVINGRYEPKDEWLIVMSHLFVTDIKIHRKYDMKGSKEGRVVSQEERAQPGFTLRDYDFEEQEGTIDIGPEMAKAFKAQLEKDTAFLCQHGVMDYSLLIGIHDRDNQDKDAKATIYKHKPSQFEIENGGMPSSDGKKIYFVGLVDNLCEFSGKKYWEMCFKSCIFVTENISSVPPEKYRARFLECCERVFQ